MHQSYRRLSQTVAGPPPDIAATGLYVVHNEAMAFDVCEMHFHGSEEGPS
ncbi:MAG: hypothetical protein ACPG4Q_09460 [Phycisphaeraceae bacterium]